MSVKLLPTPETACRRSVLRLLDEAEAEGFEEIVLVGIRKSGDFMVMGSRTMSTIRRVGALQMALHDTIEMADEAG